MSRANFSSEMTARAQSCLRAIRAAVAGDAPTSRGDMLATLRLIRAKAREAEILLAAERRGLDRWRLTGDGR